jgi:DNA-binding CsgD family transcriptional regulator
LRINIERYNLPRSEIEFLINQWIFNKRDREILVDRLLDGLTFERLAEKHNLSVQQVKTIVYKSMNKLEKHI